MPSPSRMRKFLPLMQIAAVSLAFVLSAPHPAFAADKDNKDKTKLPDRPLVETFKTDSKPCGGTGSESARRQSIDGVAYGVVPDPALETYLNHIKDRLLQVSPVPNCAIHVYVIPQEHFAAAAAADGAIFLPLGLLRDLKNEDEIAAVLGHEISHILKRHHESDSFLKAQANMLKAGDTLMGAYSVVQQFSGTAPAINGQTTMNIAEAVYAVSENVIAPSWTSKQEDEADLLGADLFIKAGYNKAAIGTMMAKLEDWEKKIAQRDAKKDAFVQASMQANAMSVMGAASSAMAAPSAASLGSLAANLAPGLIKSAASASKGEDHRPVAERKADMIQYLGAFYRTSPRPALEAAPWQQQQAAQVFSNYAAAAKARMLMEAGQMEQASKLAAAGVSGPTANHAYPRLAMYEIASRQGRPDAAANIGAILRNPSPPIAGYRYAASEAIKTGRLAEAAGYIDQANQRYGTPLSFIPESIKFYQQSGNPQKVQPLLMQCQAKGDKAMYAVCQSAAGGQAGTPAAQQNNNPFPGMGRVGGNPLRGLLGR